MSYKKSRNIFFNTPLLSQIVLVILVVGGLLLSEKFVGKLPLSDPDFAKEASLLFDFDNMKRKFEGEVAANMTVLDALNAAVAAGKINLTYTVNGRNDTAITKINGHQAGENKKFFFYVDGESIDAKDLNKIFISPGDEITVKLE